MRRILACLALLLAAPAFAQEGPPLYQYQDDGEPRWASPENPNAEKGAGGRENMGGKGRAYESIPPGKSLVLAKIEGAGIIDRMWLTVMDRSPEMLRSLRLDIWWDDATSPAVSVPLGDFFLAGAGALVPYETALLASPEGRSFVSYIPMPFRKFARIMITNESARPVHQIYWDVDFRRLRRPARDMLYFHASWRREHATTIGRDFAILGRVRGRGRFLGTAVTVFTNPAYGKAWWGEGEIKFYFDLAHNRAYPGADPTYPTLVGTGTEDYIGTGWGQGAYAHRYQGSLVADEANGRWTFYRFHVPDPIFFAKALEIDLQQIGGAMKADVQKLIDAGVPLRPVSIAAGTGGRSDFVKLLSFEKGPPLSEQPDGWTNFYRSDDVSAVAYFYLDRAEPALQSLPPVAERIAALRPPKP